MTSRQTALDTVKNEMELGRMTAAQANVYMVQIEGVRLVTGKLNREVRKALNEAVKAGELGHLKKDGLKPEAYFHKNGRARAIEARNREFNRGIESLKKIAI